MALFKKKQQEVVEPPIDLNATGVIGPEKSQREIAARQSEVVVPVKELIYDAIVRRAEKVMLDYTREMASGRYLIDGVWHNIEPRERALGDAMLVVLKTLAGLKPEERRARQEGEFQVEHQVTRAKFTATITSQGVKTGERVILELRAKKGKVLKSLDDLGMRDTMQEKLKEAMRGEGGLVLISAPPAGGFSTLWNVALNSTDRYLRDFACLEDEAHPETRAENVNVTTFNGPAGETPDQMLKKLMLTQPDVLALPDLCNAATVNQLCRLATDPREPRLVIAGVRAKDAIEALLRVLLLKASGKEFAQAIRAVVNVRLVRRLNDTCKQAYQPPPQLLKQLGIPQGRVKVLYKEWSPPPPDPEEEAGKKKKKPPLPPGACPLCEQEGPLCQGLGYRERTGIFELLDVNDALRDALVKQPKLEVLKKVARQSGHRGLQEEGILLVAQGTTSLSELKRVMA